MTMQEEYFPRACGYNYGPLEIVWKYAEDYINRHGPLPRDGSTLYVGVPPAQLERYWRWYWEDAAPQIFDPHAPVRGELIVLGKYHLPVPIMFVPGGK